MMHNWDSGWGFGNWLVMGFGMLLFWAVVAVAVVWLVRYSANGRSEAGRPNALAILDERYARGEISDEEYRARRNTLGFR